MFIFCEFDEKCCGKKKSIIFESILYAEKQLITRNLCLHWKPYKLSRHGSSHKSQYIRFDLMALWEVLKTPSMKFQFEVLHVYMNNAQSRLLPNYKLNSSSRGLIIYAMPNKKSTFFLRFVFSKMSFDNWTSIHVFEKGARIYIYI